MEGKKQSVSISQRQNLPRTSKTNHKVISETAPAVKVINPNIRSRKGSRNNQ